MIARLQRFYGGPPAAWLHLPVPVLRAYSEMLPRLQAEETLARVSSGAAAAGTLRQEELSRYLAGLERTAGRRARPADAAALASMGIRVEREGPGG